MGNQNLTLIVLSFSPFRYFLRQLFIAILTKFKIAISLKRELIFNHLICERLSSYRSKAVTEIFSCAEKTQLIALAASHQMSPIECCPEPWSFHLALSLYLTHIFSSHKIIIFWATQGERKKCFTRLVIFSWITYLMSLPDSYDSEGNFMNVKVWRFWSTFFSQHLVRLFFTKPHSASIVQT